MSSVIKRKHNQLPMLEGSPCLLTKKIMVS